MTDQEIIDKAVAEIRVFQDEVNRKTAEREAKANRFRILVAEVRKQTGCENITAERYEPPVVKECPIITIGINMTPTQKKELRSLENLIEKIRKFAVANVEWYETPKGFYIYHPLFNKRNAVILASRAFMKELR